MAAIFYVVFLLFCDKIKQYMFDWIIVFYLVIASNAMDGCPKYGQFITIPYFGHPTIAFDRKLRQSFKRHYNVNLQCL